MPANDKRKSESHDESTSHRRWTSRRPFLKTTGAGIAGVALAGCSGSGSGDSAGESGGGTTTGTSGSGDSNQFSGTTLKYWNQMNVQSRKAKAISQELIGKFQSNTGAKVKVNWSGYGDVIGAKWKTSFSQGNYPVMYDSVTTWDGQFIAGDWIKPFDEYKDEFSDELLSAIEWIYPNLKSQYRGFGDGETVYELPFGFLLQAPLVARLDHFDEAGIDRSRFPPKDYDDLIDIATTLQQDGPGKYGYQIHGTSFDATDVRLSNFAVASGGKDGLFLNDDWSETNWDNDVWKTAVRQWVEIFTKHGLSNPETPNHDDEAMVQELASGQTSINSGDFLNHPDMVDMMGDKMDSGDVQWGAPWKGQSGEMAIVQPFCVGLTKPPKGADEAEWEKKQSAAIEFMKLWFEKDFQKNLFENFGLFPIRQDVWEELPTAEHKLYSTAKKMAKNSNLSWSAHPQTVSVQYNIPGPHLQKALNGEISPEEACNNIATDIRNQVL